MEQSRHRVRANRSVCRCKEGVRKALELDRTNTYILSNYDLFREIYDRQNRRRILSSAAVGVAGLGCTSFYEIPVETPVQAKIDVTSFQRVLVAGFIGAGSGAIDANTETARLLRSQLRSKQDLRVIDADVLLLAEEMDKRMGRTTAAVVRQAASGSDELLAIKDEADLKAYEPIFSDSEYWKSVGDEYQDPLIITGSVIFSPVERSGMVSRPQSSVDPNTGLEAFRTQRVYSEMKGFSLTPKFMFIDGRTGALLHSEEYQEEVLYPATQNTPALSSYFELMDKLPPGLSQHAQYAAHPRIPRPSQVAAWLLASAPVWCRRSRWAWPEIPNIGGVWPRCSRATAAPRAPAVPWFAEGTLAERTYGLLDAVETPLPAGHNLLLVVDQFEEIFPFRDRKLRKGAGSEADLFVSYLLRATQDQAGRVYEQRRRKARTGASRATPPAILEGSPGPSPRWLGGAPAASLHCASAQLGGHGSRVTPLPRSEQLVDQTSASWEPHRPLADPPRRFATC